MSPRKNGLFSKISRVKNRPASGSRPDGGNGLVCGARAYRKRLPSDRNSRKTSSCLARTGWLLL